MPNSRKEKLYYNVGTLEAPVAINSNNFNLLTKVLTQLTVAPNKDRYNNWLEPNTGSPAELDRYAITAHFVPSSLGLPAGGGEEFAYFTSVQHVAIPLEARFPFDTDVQKTAGFVHTASANPAVSGDITIVTAGTYEVIYTATVDEPRQVALFLDGAAVPSTEYGGATGTTTTTGVAIITVTAGQLLSLRNHTSTGAITPSVAAGSGPGTIIVNSLAIRKIGSAASAAGVTTVLFRNAVTHVNVDDPATVPEVEVLLNILGMSGGTVSGTLYVQKQHNPIT